MENMKNQVYVFLFVLLIAQTVQADPPVDLSGLVGVANILGALMLVFLGIKWIIADAAQERNEIKKGVLYIIIGILIANGYQQFVAQFYTANLPT
ncbi:MAG: hypothetical protein GF334_12965 [Candidatus Altiarchaeales archaeon]|nr:hypothetical protein [Candidatus Altiarchaeales archaeon]